MSAARERSANPSKAQADTFDALKELVRNAVHCHFEERTRPQIIRLRLVRDVVIPV
jgi:hypothetical protein